MTNNGFTLIEILLAIVVISIGLVGVISLYPVVSKASVITEEKVLVVNSVRQKMEQIITMDFVAISTGNPSSLSDTVAIQNKQKSRRVDVIYLDNNNNETATATDLKKIRVILSGYKCVSIKTK